MSSLIQGDSTIDQKVLTLYNLYQDNHQVSTSLKDVEQMRTRAKNIGIMTTIAAFGLNEVARLTMRSPMFKLKLQNIAFFALAPSMISRYAYQEAINDRVDNLWRIHQNREKKGMGGSYRSHGNYDERDHTGDRSFSIPNGIHLSMDSIVSGLSQTASLDNPFTRYHKSIEDYPAELDNMDDAKMYKTDNFERLKPLMPKDESVVGTTSVIPNVDTDEKLIWYDTQGESLYTNPPNPNTPTIDHGLDEDLIWAFRKTNYNQKVVYNHFTRDLWGALKERKAPWWGIKLASPAFSKDEKFTKFLQQYAIRIDFERLKLHHAKTLRKGDLVQRDQHLNEITAFIENAEQKMRDIEMQDVYVTDHKPQAAKYSTLSEEEDMEYYNYTKAVEEYNKQSMRKDRVSRFESGRYERGSLKQRIFEPLADAVKLDNGTTFMELTDKDIAKEVEESLLRSQFDKINNQQVLEGEDEAEIRASMFDALEEHGIDTEEWDKILAREFDTFKSGEKYDYVTDLRRTFDTEVATPMSQKIFKKLPEHVFWDIKKPLVKGDEQMYLNPYNTARKYPFESFFDMRRHEDWLESKETQRNINTNISGHTRV